MAQDNPDIKTRVLEKIHNGTVHIRPRARFISQVVLIALLSFVALVLAVFVMSFAIFSLYESGEQFLLGFGHRGVLVFFTLFPWIPFIVDIFLFIVIEWFLRHFKFGYHIPIVRFLVGVAAVAFVVSVVVNLTPLHQVLLNRADSGTLPFLEGWYETIHDSHAQQGVFRGIITSIQGNAFIIGHNDNDRDADDGTWTVIEPSGYAATNVHTGDRVLVAGDAAQGTIRAYGIRILAGNK